MQIIYNLNINFSQFEEQLKIAIELIYKFQSYTFMFSQTEYYRPNTCTHWRIQRLMRIAGPPFNFKIRRRKNVMKEGKNRKTRKTRKKQLNKLYICLIITCMFMFIHVYKFSIWTTPFSPCLFNTRVVPLKHFWIRRCIC